MRSALLLIAALTATSATAMPPRHGDHSQTSDPNKVICHSEPVLGSRLQVNKTCHTAQEWADLRQQQRDTVERVQSGGLMGPGH